MSRHQKLEVHLKCQFLFPWHLLGFSHEIPAEWSGHKICSRAVFGRWGATNTSGEVFQGKVEPGQQFFFQTPVICIFIHVCVYFVFVCVFCICICVFSNTGREAFQGKVEAGQWLFQASVICWEGSTSKCSCPVWLFWLICNLLYIFSSHQIGLDDSFSPQKLLSLPIRSENG